MNELLSAPAFWMCASIAAYCFGLWCQRAARSPLANPLLIASVLIGAILLGTNTPLTVYDGAGGVISFFLAPATVALALPIYRKREVLRRNLLPILCGALAGSVVSVGSVILFSRLFGLSETTLRSLIPKSVTTPIGVALSAQLGGIASITTVAIIFTGIVGAVLLPAFLRLIGVRDSVQMGLSIGTAAHAVGTARAIELGETEGAISGLAIGVAGLMTALLVSLAGLFGA